MTRAQHVALWALVIGFGTTVGCGGDDGPGTGTDDAGSSMDSGGADTGTEPAECGNTLVEGGEECDDGNDMVDDGCTPECTLECGDGAVTGDERCDTAIAAGEDGACPTECDDSDPCTTDAIDGVDCSQECSHAPITAAVDGDSCCPDGADATTDDDCTSICGNGIVEPDESCDTEIEAGETGACPTACDDSMDCTSDALVMDGTCDAACEHTTITAAVDGDLCCPSGETIATDSDCGVMCGDGVVSSGETCDTAISSGTGACPAACDDGVACTADELVNAGTCTATCASTAITTPADGDGCCPAGATIADDDDCTATCGDGTVSGGESCDTGISSGAGSCPTSCSDGVACTEDVLTGAGTCAATCSYPAITTPADGDGCCPTGATIATDDDCAAACGDGVVTSPETCDTAISGGGGACPTACDDGDPCTTDTLANAGTCRAQCTTTPVGAGPADSCCPAGADLGDDPDCPPACGDGVVTAPETCDDGNTVDGDGCSSTCTAEPIAFRFTDLDLKDPHVYAEVFGCLDVTDFSLGSLLGVNPLIQQSIQQDDRDPDDGLLDLSIAHVFAPLLQTAGMSTPSYLVFPDCTAPMSSTTCTLPAGATKTTGDAMNMGGTAICLEPISGTTSYSGINRPQAGGGGTCYVASAGTVMIDLSGIPITLQNAYIAGEWYGTPATEIRDGLIRGFMSEAAADATIIPAGLTGFDSIDGQPLSSLLRGGTDNCSRPAPMTGDKDTYMGTTGWYFYLNFRAVRVPYTEL